MPSLLNENQKTNKVTGMLPFDSNGLAWIPGAYLEKRFRIRIGNGEADGTYISHRRWPIPFYYVYIMLLGPSKILSTLVLL
jgi:hypothetical protein